MQEEKKQFWIGCFIAAGIGLAILFLIGLGAGDFLSPKVTVITAFPESIQGLEVGSPVKFRGVRIGRVSDIHILANSECVMAEMEVDPKVFAQGWNGENFSIPKLISLLRRANELGYGCRLEFSGLTGMKYIEINKYSLDKQNKLPPPVGLPPETIYVASVPSIYSDATQAVEVSLARLAKVDFAAIGSNLNDSLNELKALLRDPALRNTLDRMDRISENAEKASSVLASTLTEQEVKGIVQGLNKTIASINQLSASLDQELKRLDLPTLGKRVDGTVQSIQKLADSLRRAEENFDWTLHKIDQFLDLAGELVEYVSKDPNSILKGKRAPEILPSRK